MLYVFIPGAFNLISKINEGIAKEEGAIGSIRTWEYNEHYDRYAWENSDAANWRDLDQRAYFKAVNGFTEDRKKYVKFTLHAKRGISLSQGEYSKMHSELLYMIMAHFGKQIDRTVVSKVPANNTDVQD